jgi:hypothetical protein
MISIIKVIENETEFKLTEKVQIFSKVIEVFMTDDLWCGWDIDSLLGVSSAFDIALWHIHSDWFEV